MEESLEEPSGQGFLFWRIEGDGVCRLGGGPSGTMYVCTGVGWGIFKDWFQGVGNSNLCKKTIRKLAVTYGLVVHCSGEGVDGEDLAWRIFLPCSSVYCVMLFM